MADVYNYIDSTGTITTDAGEINTQVQDEYKNTFGADLVTTPNTPQGMLITVESLARIAVADNNANLANQINPNLAGGTFLDAILALTGNQRTGATYTTVYATVTGVVGTTIPAGSQASSDGNYFATTQDVTIPEGGSQANVVFQSVTSGDIACNAGTLTTIVTAVLGWETVTNPDNALVIGAATQSDQSAKLYRANTLALQGTSQAQAITSAVLDQYQGGASSLKFLENIASTTQTIDGVTMVSHSIYICADPGTNTTATLGTESTVIGTITGTPDTSIASGSQAASGSNVFQTLNTVVIPASGSIDVTFQALQSGTILCPAGTLTTITTPISGWDSVTNAFGTSNDYTVVIGTITGTSTTVVPAGSQASSAGNVFQTLESVTIPSGGSIETTFQAVNGGYISCPAGSLVNIVTPVSGWTSVTNQFANTSTGTSSTIAEAMVATKSAGAAYNNGPGTNQSAQIIVPYSNQVMTVLFDTPTIIQISVAVTATVYTPVQDPESTIRTAILNYANGLLSGIPGLVVGQNVSAFEIAGAITSQYPGIYVSECYIAFSPSAPSSSDELTIDVYQQAQIQSNDIYVTLV